MPRGPTVYSLPPGTTPQLPNTVIASAMFNAAMDDIATTFNTLQPPAYGGTGATSAVAGWDALVAKGIDIASASNINLTTATGARVDITGTTTITGVTMPDGAFRIARATGIFQMTASATLVINRSASVSYTTGVGDLIFFQRDGSAVSVWTVSGSTSLARQLLLASNYSLSATVAGNDLTITMLGGDGAALSSSNVATVPFRNVTATSGVPSWLDVSAPQSVVVPNTATMGFTSAVPGKIWIVGFNDGGTFRLAVINCRNGDAALASDFAIYPLEAFGVASSNAVTTGADSAAVFYSTVGVTSKAYTVLGYILITEATAGVWATAPTRVQLFGASTRLPNAIAQTVGFQTGTVASGTTVLPVDNTIPQSTEGDQYMSRTIVPIELGNLYRARHNASYTNTAAGAFAVAMFGAGANALRSNVTSLYAANVGINVSIEHIGVLDAGGGINISIRAGAAGAGTTRFNGYNGAQVFGGVSGAFLTIEEIVA